MLNTVQIVASTEWQAAGPSYTVPSLARALDAQDDVTSTLMSLGPPCKTQTQGVKHIKYKADLKWAGPLARLGPSRALKHGLKKSNADILHTHGLWMMPNVYPADIARSTGASFVLTPRGMLGTGALKFSATKKRIFWIAAQKRAIAQADLIHATAVSELEEIRNFGINNPVAIIPNGVDLPDLTHLRGHNNTAAPSPYVLSLGRIHPKKGYDRLIAAWAKISSDYPTWRLRIVGPDEIGHAQDLLQQAHRLKVADSVSIEDPVFGKDKDILMRDAEIFALATLSENFAMTVAESLAVETPVISTKGAPWAGLETHGAGWWVDHGSDPMAQALRDAMSLSSSQRKKMGTKGKDWMQRDFGWAGIGSKMAETYRWLRNESEKPDWVEL